MVDPLALTALIISLVALLATVGQLLQQYFATADGFRRCQPSVMGLWARKTKLRWRWAEFRFETVFAIARITYTSLIEPVGTGTNLSGRRTLTNILEVTMTLGGWDSFDARKYYESDELACWVPLLSQLHRQGQAIVGHFAPMPAVFNNIQGVPHVTLPSIQFITKSWDFMPPDVVRPLASTTVSDVAIMVRRLGMIWKAFDPSTGSMRAEVNGYVITSTMARSLGTILQYSFISKDNAQNCAYIPVTAAGKLGFGLVEFDSRLFGTEMAGDLNVLNSDGIKKTLRLIVTASVYKDRGDIAIALEHISNDQA